MVLPDPVGLEKPPPTWHQQRMPGPHGFAVRFSAVRLRAVDRSQVFRQPALRSLARTTLLRPPHPIPTFVTMANVPLGDGMARVVLVIWGWRQEKFGKSEIYVSIDACWDRE
jgi:hypothetical protein